MPIACGRAQAALTAATDAVAALRAVDPRALPLDELRPLLVEAAGLATAVEAVVVRAVGALDDREGWRGTGSGGTRSWLGFHTGDGTGVTGQRVRSARLASRYRAVDDALAAGRIRPEQVASLARVAVPARRELFVRDVAALVEAAAELDVDAFDTVVRRWASIADDELDRLPRSLRDQLDRRRLHLRDSTNGMVHLDGFLPGADAAVVRAALDRLDTPDPADAPEGPRSPAQRAADHLVELARRFLTDPGRDGGGGSGRGSGGGEAALLVTVPLDVFAGDPEATDRVAGRHRECGLVGGTPLPPEAVRRFGCSGWVASVLFSAEHEVLAHGRRHRLFTPAQRRAIDARDGGCVFPGCDRPTTWCQAHHLDPWGPPSHGPTDVANGCLLCGYHHTLVHEGGWALRHDPDGGWTCFDLRRRPVASTTADRRRRPPPDGPTPPARPTTQRPHRPPRPRPRRPG